MREITCPLEAIFHILRGKWAPMIVWRARLGNQRLTDLKKDILNCNEKMLIQHINELLEYGVLEKIEYDVYPKHTEYKLTEFGWNLRMYNFWCWYLKVLTPFFTFYKK